MVVILYCDTRQGLTFVEPGVPGTDCIMLLWRDMSKQISVETIVPHTKSCCVYIT